MTLRHTIRRLLQQPVFSLIAILTLAIGIGANSAIFAVIEGVLLKPLPFANPEQLVDADHTAPGVHMDQLGAAPFLVYTYRAESHVFQSVGLWRPDTDSVTGLAEPQELPDLDFDASMLSVLQVNPLLGRGFIESDTLPNAPDTVILCYGFWKAQFGGDPNAIGRMLMINSKPRQIIGVLPESFHFLDRKPSFVVPIKQDPDKIYLGQFSFSSIGRLKPGFTIAQANSDAERMITIAMHRYPAFPGYSEKMFEDARLGPKFISLKASLLGDIGKLLWVLMGTVGMVLLIACANVANLMLVRGQGRQHELAIRSALGASWWQVARELLGESVVLGVLGGVVGLGLSFGAIRLLQALKPANFPRLDQIALDLPAILFTVLLSILAGALFGLIPAIKYATPRISMSLRAGGRSVSESRERHRARNVLVVVQMALALVLLISSGLMIRTFVALRSVNPGFANASQLQVFGIYIPPTAVKDEVATVRMQQAILDKVAAIPGVTQAALTSALPMSGNHWSDPIFVEGQTYAETSIPPIRRFVMVAPGMFQTFGIPLIAGRDFTWTDVYEEHDFVLLSENMAKEIAGSPQAAIGKRVRENLNAPWHQVIGVVGDVREDGVDQPAPPTAYFEMLQHNFEGDTPFIQRGIGVVARSSRAGTSGFVSDLSKAVWSVNPNLPLANVQTQQDLYGKSLARTSFALVMLAIAGAMALLLGVAGIYGVISYSVSQRTREVGIRKALGAQNGQVAGMFVKQAARLALIGIACGLAASFVLMRLMASMLFNVKPADPLTYAAISVVLCAAALLASYVPALRATGLDPVDALRVD